MEPRWKKADDELREVSERLESSLRARYPGLFDRHGRLRAAELARLLAEQVGGKQASSGEELRLLEDQAAAADGRSEVCGWFALT